MSSRSYEDAADEYEAMSFFQSVGRFSACFSELDLGELMAMGGKFLELSYGAAGAEADEQETAAVIARAIDEVIVFRLKANTDALRKYLDAKRKHVEYLQSTLPTDQPSPSVPSPPGASKSLFGWLNKKK
jgi:hypothetical protein